MKVVFSTIPMQEVGTVFYKSEENKYKNKKSSDKLPDMGIFV